MFASCCGIKIDLKHNYFKHKAMAHPLTWYLKAKKLKCFLVVAAFLAIQ